MTNIVVENAAKSFNEHQLFSGLSFHVDSGQLTALTGPSGSGKSTLLNCIGLLERLDKGQIYVEDKKIARMNP